MHGDARDELCARVSSLFSPMPYRSLKDSTKEHGVQDCLWSRLHLTSVTITTGIPGVGGRFSSWVKLHKD